MRVKKDSDRNKGKTSYWTEVYSMENATTICVSLYHQDLRGFKTDNLSNRSVTNKKRILINITGCLLCLYHSIETKNFKVQQEFAKENSQNDF